MKVFLLLVLFIVAFAEAAQSAVIELTALAAYGRSRFADGYSSRQNRYTGSVEFKFTSISSIQFEYSQTTTKISFPVPTSLCSLLGSSCGSEAITYLDQVYSFNWIQNLVPSKFIIQPYFKIGGGKLFRRQTTELTTLGIKQINTENVATGIAGLGIRIFLTRNMALKGEIASYVPDFKFAQWKDNQLFSTGLSWMF